MVEVVTLQPAGRSTRVVYRQALDPKWWVKPLLPLVRRRLERALRQGLAGLGPWVSRRAQPSADDSPAPG
jgi:hypothetical protein